MSSDFAFLVQHPLVLKAAWLRVMDWYSQSWPPEPEYAAWRLEPERHLAQLGRELATGRYQPTPFSLIPHPKKGGMLRHLCMPSVRDQVAFMVLGCLLAPLAEGPMPNFSFGNRIFRKARAVWHSSRGVVSSADEGGANDSTKPKKLWKSLPFSLSDPYIYQPYKRAHGMFRRVIHWSAAALTKSRINQGKATGHALKPDDYLKHYIPPFATRGWWNLKERGDKRAGYWARLDLQLAFPSADIPYLLDQVEELFSPTLQQQIELISSGTLAARFGRTSWKDALRGYPSEISEKLIKSETLKIIKQKLREWLSAVRYEPLEVSDSRESALADLWRPPHTDQALPLGDGHEHPGIPTGLAISGLLLNIYLYGFDRYMLDRALTQQKKGRPFAVFRFVDDIVLLAPSIDELAAEIDAAWCGLAGTSTTLVSRSPSSVPSNLRVNWAKVEPEPLAKLLSRYLADHWKQETCKCGIVLPPRDPVKPFKERTFQKWLRSKRRQLKEGALDTAAEEISRELRKLERESIRRSRLGAFVTYLVERLSALANDGLQNRFGDGASRRLVELHELVRFDFDDQQVKEETRLSFAANNLAKAWLTEESRDTDRKQLSEIRRSIRHALQKAPAKFQLWRSIVRAAVRRPLGGLDDASTHEDRELARAWLRKMLHLVSGGERGLFSTQALEQFPEIDKLEYCWRHTPRNNFSIEDIELRSKETMRQYYSFLRAAFWRYLAQTLLELQRIAVDAEETDVNLDMGYSWTSRSWLFRALPEGEIGQAFKWLSMLDDWLVGEPSRRTAILNRWEMDSIVIAVLASTPREELLEYVRLMQTQNFDQASEELYPLRVPIELKIFNNNKDMQELLERKRRLVFPGQLTEDMILPLLMLAATKQGDSKTLVKSLMSFSLSDRKERLHEIIASLRISSGVPSVQALRWGKDALACLQRLPWQDNQNGEDLITWHEKYRQIHLHAVRYIKNTSAKQRPVTLYRILWGDLWQKDQLVVSAKIQPESAPELGLPLRVALKLFMDALESVIEKEEIVFIDPFPPKASCPVIWVIQDDEVQNFLSWGRRRQFLGTKAGRAKNDLPAKGKKWVQIKSNLDSWEVLPHPTFFRPQALGLPMGSLGYELWCHSLLFLVACDGSERILDLLGRNGAKPLKFSESWEMRDRIHLPPDLWDSLDLIVRQGLLKPRQLSDYALTYIKDLIEIIKKLLKQSIGRMDFIWERFDIVLSDRKGQTAPSHISKFSLDRPTPLPKGLVLAHNELKDNLCVRIGQLVATPNWNVYYRYFPGGVPRATVQAIMREVSSSVQSLSPIQALGTAESQPAQQQPELVILPEAMVPFTEIEALRQLVQQERRAVLCGALFRPMRRAISGPRSFLRWIVNEAHLFFPVLADEQRGLPLVRHFVIRKPMPTYVEFGFAEALSARKVGSSARTTEWKMLSGQRWFRFLHRRWGDFTVAICSDLIDPSPWWSLRAQVLHVFMCAQNLDVDLFESLSWIRAYENYCNIVSVNHGCYGGSFAWTPKRNHERELAKLRGKELLLLADVKIPIKGLYEAQVYGPQWAHDNAVAGWKGKNKEKAGYKTPPPTFWPRKFKKDNGDAED
jgi:hypothetical protein